MNKTNTDYLMKMTKDYLDGNIDLITYTMDFPHEVSARYENLLEEDKIMAELIYNCLIEDGIHLYDKMPEDEFKQELEEQYQYLIKIYDVRFN